MSTKKISSSLPDKAEEVVLSVKLVEKGKYRKVTTVAVRDRKTGMLTKKSKKVTVSDDLYGISSKDDFDFMMRYQDIDGTETAAYFKKIVEDTTIA